MTNRTALQIAGAIDAYWERRQSIAEMEEAAHDVALEGLMDDTIAEQAAFDDLVAELDWSEVCPFLREVVAARYNGRDDLSTLKAAHRLADEILEAMRAKAEETLENR